jgi:glycosyltransferase involved in cell wall biosynthesis
MTLVWTIGMMRMDSRHVTACIPYFRCKRYIARAVESILAQTYRNLTVVVINDGDKDPPWRELSHIKDTRLVRFNLQANRGPFFATEVVLRAISSPYFLIQDSDDWSSPERVELLLTRLEREKADLAVSTQPVYEEKNGRQALHSVRWSGAPGPLADMRFRVDRKITAQFRYRVPHHGLFRTASLRKIGGYYAGIPTKYDTLLTNLILMTGKVSHENAGLYHRLWRNESLTHSSSTGVGSRQGNSELSKMSQIYRACFLHYSAFLSGKTNCQVLGAKIRNICFNGITRVEHKWLTWESQRLAGLIAGTQ